jgi:hypothetical protein
VITFKCGACGNTVYFDNVKCLSCGHALGFQSARLELVTLAPAAGGRLREVKRGAGTLYSYCANAEHGVCNWLVPASAGTPFCAACALNRTIPNLSEPANLRAWGDFERAKKRLVYSLFRFGLPVDGTSIGRGSLAFDFVADALTGHLGGVITIAVGEADAVERERQREAMSERYRSLLGHLRHESGHYYWMLLIQDTDKIAEFRCLFGDEREDYRASLNRHHEQGPRADWSQQYVSAYASAHPWEDWAETWAHYLHMVDALDTAATMKIEPRTTSRYGGEALRSRRQPDVYRDTAFEALIERWLPLTLALNELNRSMGHHDFYPFVITEEVETKLKFVHQVIRKATMKGAMAPVAGKRAL